MLHVGYLMIWLSGLTLCLSCLSWIFDSLSENRKSRYPRASTLWISLIVFIPALGMTGLGLWLDFYNIMPLWLFPYSFSWCLGLILGLLVILRHDLLPPHLKPAWKHIRSFTPLISVISLILWFGAIGYVDLRIRVLTANEAAKGRILLQNILLSRGPEETGAWNDYQKAFERLQALQPNTDLMGVGLVPQYPIPSTYAPLIDKYREILPHLYSAAEKPNCVFQINIENPILSHIPSGMNFKQAAQLLAMNCDVKIQSGDFEGASRDISVMRRMASHLRQNPLMTSQMAAVFIERRQLACAEFLMARAPNFNPPILQQTESGLRHRQGFVRAIQMENAALLIVFNEFDPSEFLTPLRREGRIHPAFTGFFGRLWSPFIRLFLYGDDLRSINTRFSNLRSVYEKPYHAAPQNRHNIMMDHPDHPPGVLTSLISPNFGAADLRISELEAMDTLYQTAIAIRKYQIQHRQFPNSLKDLVPKFLVSAPIDPFTGQPLLFLKDADGIVLYSVGADLKDNGGNSTLNPNGGIEGDIIFGIGGSFDRHRQQSPASTNSAPTAISDPAK